MKADGRKAAGVATPTAAAVMAALNSLVARTRRIDHNGLSICTFQAKGGCWLGSTLDRVAEAAAAVVAAAAPSTRCSQRRYSACT